MQPSLLDAVGEPVPGIRGARQECTLFRSHAFSTTIPTSSPYILKRDVTRKGIPYMGPIPYMGMHTLCWATYYEKTAAHTSAFVWSTEKYAEYVSCANYPTAPAHTPHPSRMHGCRGALCCGIFCHVQQCFRG